MDIEIRRVEARHEWDGSQPLHLDKFLSETTQELRKQALNDEGNGGLFPDMKTFKLFRLVVEAEGAGAIGIATAEVVYRRPVRVEDNPLRLENVVTDAFDLNAYRRGATFLTGMNKVYIWRGFVNPERQATFLDSSDSFSAFLGRSKQVGINKRWTSPDANLPMSLMWEPERSMTDQEIKDAVYDSDGVPRRWVEQESVERESKGVKAMLDGVL